MKSPWIETYTGVKFHPLEARPEDVRVEDIAHALSNLCRYAGHCREFYSVAQHSIIVSELCGRENVLWGLLHDASEAYLADIPRPIKARLPDYKRIENELMWVIALAFNLPWPMPLEVLEIDHWILKTEHRDVMAKSELVWEVDNLPSLDIEITHLMDPREAEAAFLRRFDFLTSFAGEAT